MYFMERFFVAAPVIALAVSLGCCTPTMPMPSVPIDPLPETADVPPPSARQETILQRLDALVPVDHRARPWLEDIRAVLRAQEGDEATAPARWREALSLGRSKWSQDVAFSGWIRAELRSQRGRRLSRSASARYLATQAALQGPGYAYFSANNLIREDLWPARLKALGDEWFGPEDAPADSQGKAPASGAVPPSIPGVPLDDIALASTAMSLCKAPLGTERAREWIQWAETLPPAPRKFLEGWVTHCRGRIADSLRLLKESADLGRRDRGSHPYVIHSLQKIISILREEDQRQHAADLYPALVEAWKLPGVAKAQGHWSGTDRRLVEIDDVLWAARYRLLVGDSESGRTFAQRAIGLVAAAEPLMQEPAARRALATLRAEGYHLLAFRIAVESGAYESAASYTSLAAQNASLLSQEWKERLGFCAGLYEYLGGNKALALSRWDSVLSESPTESTKARLFYWLARVHHELGNTAERDTYRRLLDEQQPLSFYSVVAMPTLDPQSSPLWIRRFAAAAPLDTRLRDNRAYAFAEERRDSRLLELLVRGEVLAALKVTDWATQALREVEEHLGPVNRYSSGQVALAFYVSRLYTAAGAYAEAMRLTSAVVTEHLGQWDLFPEQLLVHFPQPYLREIGESARRHQVEPSILLAVGRQESAFQPRARSPAGAVGLMQFILPTARKLAASAGISTQSVREKDLEDPQVSLLLAGAYLSVLGGRYEGRLPFMAASYNAGEFAVDGWLTRRSHPDPLVWVELIPYHQTQQYVRGVWRNAVVYQALPGLVSSSRSLTLENLRPTIAHQRRASGHGKSVKGGDRRG